MKQVGAVLRRRADIPLGSSTRRTKRKINQKINEQKAWNLEEQTKRKGDERFLSDYVLHVYGGRKGWGAAAGRSSTGVRDRY